MKKTCKLCHSSFDGRANKIFCSNRCRKQSHQHIKRQAMPQNAQHSKEIRRKQSELFELASRLAERLYTMPVEERLGYMETLINHARGDSQPDLRRILMLPQLIYARNDEPHKFWRRCPYSYRTISQAADNYCKRFWRKGIVFVIKHPNYYPETGEVD